MKWREAVLWALAAVLCIACAVAAVVEVPAFHLDIDLRASSVAESEASSSASSVVSALININEASAAELETLPGIGEVIAERIVEYRERVGGFESVEQLKQVSGIGDKKFAAVEDLVCV